MHVEKFHKRQLRKIKTNARIDYPAGGPRFESITDQGGLGKTGSSMYHATYRTAQL